MLDSLSEKDRKTIRYGAMIIVVYLTLFYGRTILSAFESSRVNYFAQLDEAKALEELFSSYENKVLKVEKFREQYQLNVRELSSTNLVGNAGRAIQDLVKESDFKLGQIRETLASGGTASAATFQVEGTGPLKSLMPLLHRLQSTGYPMILDTLSIRTDEKKRGHVLWSATIVVLDYAQWKTKGGNRA